MDLARNVRARYNNKTGHRGVYKRGNRWMACYVVAKKKFYLGLFDRIEDAVAARAAALEALV